MIAREFGGVPNRGHTAAHPGTYAAYMEPILYERAMDDLYTYLEHAEYSVYKKMAVLRGCFMPTYDLLREIKTKAPTLYKLMTIPTKAFKELFDEKRKGMSKANRVSHFLDVVHRGVPGLHIDFFPDHRAPIPGGGSSNAPLHHGH